MKKFLSALLVLVFVTSCSSNDGLSKSSETQEKTKIVQEVGGTNGALIPIASSNVMAAGYDAQNQIMKVQFKNGTLYEYYGVQLELWVSFIGAQPNPWSTVGYPRLVGEGYQYRRIN